MDIDWFWVGIVAIIAMVVWQEEKQADRCFEAARQHIELKGCKP